MFQKTILGIILFFSSVIVAFFLVIKVIDFNEYKPKIQKTLKEATGYDVAIKGDITLSLSPVGIRIFDVEVRNTYHKPNDLFAKLDAFDIAVEIVPLFKKEIKIRHVALEKLDVTIEKNKDGKYNFEQPDTRVKNDKKTKEVNATALPKEDYFSLVNIKKVKFLETNITYKDATTGNKIGAEKINISIDDISLDSAKHSKIQGLYFKADATLDKLYFNKHNIYSLSMNAEMKDALLTMENLKYTLFDSLFQGTGKLDISGKVPRISLKHKIQELKLDKVTEALLGRELLKGQASAELKLACLLADETTMKSTLSGFFHLHGDEMSLLGYDLDGIASAIHEPKNFDALFQLFTQPSKESNVSQTVLKELAIKTEMGYSEIKFSDVALRTEKNRLAVKGALNIVEEKFLDIKVAFLDQKGCAVFEQTIQGTFKKPKFKLDESTVQAIAEATLSLIGKSKKSSQTVAKQEEICTPFYEGDVKHLKLN
jgi:AsmA protein